MAAFAFAPSATAYNIYSVAGSKPAEDGFFYPGFSGDGGPATDAQFNWISDVSATPDGGFLIADEYNHRIRKVSPDGVIRTVAGTGEPGFSGDGGLATEAELWNPQAIESTDDGGFLIADTYNSRIRKVSADGTITTVAPSRIERWFLTRDVAVMADGGFAVLHRDFFGANWEVTRVTASGSEVPIAGMHGNTNAGYSGDGGPAADANFRYPRGLDVAVDGSYLIADTQNNRIRRVDESGIITTVAGGDYRTFSGDGGPATEALLNWPDAVEALPDGGFLIADGHNSRVRHVMADGTISTVVGSGWGCTGDGGPAADARLGLPAGLDLTADGGLLIADNAFHRVRYVGPGIGAVLPCSIPPPEEKEPPFTASLAGGVVTAQPASRVKVRFSISSRARVRLALKKNDRVLRRVSRTIDAGRTAWSLKTPRQRGRYRVRLTAKSSTGALVVDQTRLRVRGRVG